MMENYEEKQNESECAASITAENKAKSRLDEENASHLDTHLYTCPICHLHFHSREPKLLPCLHSFCKKCLPSPSRNVATTQPSDPENDIGIKPLNMLCCPVCRQECTVVDVMDNIFMRDSVEALSRTLERTVQLCLSCDDNTEAAGFCVDCVEYLCATCVEAHRRVKFTKNHIVTQRTDISQEVHGVSSQTFCDFHKQEPLRLFCQTCDLLTCRDCQLIKHKNHNYQFIEDAHKSHRLHLEALIHQLQQKKKSIQQLSNSIGDGLRMVEKNQTSVKNEIQTSICSLVLEINKKGKMLTDQLESVTKNHERVLQKQQEEIDCLSRHLDHVISFTRWATARNEGTALLLCKRLILCQIETVLQAKCSSMFVSPSVQFQSRASLWASDVDLGSLVVDGAPGHQLRGFVDLPSQRSHPDLGPSASPHSSVLLGAHSSLAQLQMQVEKLNPQVPCQIQPSPSQSCYQSVPLPRSVPGPTQRVSSSSRMNISSTFSSPNPGFSPQHHLRGMESSSSHQTKPADVSPSSLESPLSDGVSLPQSQQRDRFLDSSRSSLSLWDDES